MAKYAFIPVGLSKPDGKILKTWTFVLFLGAILSVLALIHRGGLGALQIAPADSSAACQFEVTIDNLNVRPAPSLDNAPAQTFNRGTRIVGTVTTQNGYRELKGGLWALDQHLAPVPGSPCN